MDPRMIVTLSGAILIVVGIGLIIAQFWLGVSADTALPSRSVGFDAGIVSAEVSTTYVGLALVVIGAVLEALGLIAKRSGN